MAKITIRRYDEARDSEAMFVMMRAEGDWGDCCDGAAAEAKYKAALKDSVTYTLYNGDTCCGHIRVRDDFGFGTYIHDLLVGKAYRGNGYGKMMIDQVCKDFDGVVYVMSDADPYYNKIGLNEIEGRIIIVKK